MHFDDRKLRFTAIAFANPITDAAGRHLFRQSDAGFSDNAHLEVCIDS